MPLERIRVIEKSSYVYIHKKLKVLFFAKIVVCVLRYTQRKWKEKHLFKFEQEINF